MESDLAFAHLALRMRPLNRALRAAVAQQAAEEALLSRPDLTPYCITDDQVDRLLERVDAIDVDEPAADPTGLPLTAQERAVETSLRERATGAARALPLDELAARTGLSAVEQDMLLLALAPELDRGYERIAAYVLDDLNRRHPCVELLCTVGAGSVTQRWSRARLLGSAGRLRRHGVLRPCGGAATLARLELRVAPGVTDYLLGGGGDLPTLIADPGAVEPAALGPAGARAGLNETGRALRAGTVEVVGLWGPRRRGPAEAVAELAAAADAELRRLPAGDPAPEPAAVADALSVTAALGGILWLDVDGLDGRREAVAELIARSAAAVCLTGAEPWRPPEVLGRRGFAEIELTEPGYGARRGAWSHALPEVPAPVLDDLATRYRLCGAEVAAVASLARSRLADENGELAARVGRAATAVAHRSVSGIAHATTPRRALDDLVLPADLHAKMLELLAAFRHWPRVAEQWGFAGRQAAGVTALFAGESGTGKTLAAEVLAGSLDMVLLTVDLSQAVSKWVGETEKHLDIAFRQAEDGHAVLFFDEADALFGQRGEVRHGVDRYANLEVAYLLQRLERSDALVILASNLQENIDAAFVRRFQHVLHFARPERPERERIWQRVLPPQAPLASDVAPDALADLDLTGAGIAACARTAALLAAESGAPEITMRHLVQAVERQHQREARLLRPEDLGRHAALLGGTR